MSGRELCREPNPPHPGCGNARSKEPQRKHDPAQAPSTRSWGVSPMDGSMALTVQIILEYIGYIEDIVALLRRSTYKSTVCNLWLYTDVCVLCYCIQKYN